MEIHPGHVGFAVSLYHREKLPAVALVKAGVVGEKIHGRNAFFAKICTPDGLNALVEMYQ